MWNSPFSFQCPHQVRNLHKMIYCQVYCSIISIARQNTFPVRGNKINVWRIWSNRGLDWLSSMQVYLRLYDVESWVASKELHRINYVAIILCVNDFIVDMKTELIKEIGDHQGSVGPAVLNAERFQYVLHIDSLKEHQFPIFKKCPHWSTIRGARLSLRFDSERMRYKTSIKAHHLKRKWEHWNEQIFSMRFPAIRVCINQTNGLSLTLGHGRYQKFGYCIES